MFKVSSWRDKRLWMLLGGFLVTSLILVLVVYFLVIPSMQMSGVTSTVPGGGYTAPNSTVPGGGQSLPNFGGLVISKTQWSFEVVAPKTRLDLTLGTILCWFMLIFLNPLFRAESLRRGELGLVECNQP
jgi:hypothetical protein